MKIKELKNKPIAELKNLLLEKQESLRVMRFKVAQRQLKKVHEIKVVKRDIAQILTLLNNQQINSSKDKKEHKK